MPPADSQYLLAFRTITTMLSDVQSRTRRLRTSGPLCTTNGNDREALKVLDALSAVLVREHEILAVVSPTYDGSNIQVFASAVHPSIAEFLNFYSRVWGVYLPLP
jgi:hypothetical protein